MIKNYSYIPQNQRKKILLICDDIRAHSGVGNVAKEIIFHTSHVYNWVNIAGAKEHPDKNKRLDLSQEINKINKLEDSYLILYPTDGYGNSKFLRQVLELEKPDVIMLITDPRYFTWLFNMENEIRKTTPIIYLNIWDNFPAPYYNKPYYESCDLLLGISKQTKLINELVLGDKAKDKIISYLPHGVDEDKFKPIDKDSLEFKKFKKQILPKGSDFVVFHNSRNIRRKQTSDTILAFKLFLDTLPLEKAKRCHLIMHTEIVSPAGTNILEVIRVLMGDKYKEQIVLSHKKLSQEQLNFLYNIADAQILISSNEGWGLSLTEAILAGTPIIANVTGGMQDQMGFEDENGEWYTPSSEVPSNHRATYISCGDWAFPVFPSSISIQGSPATPYIYDDRCDVNHVVKQLKRVYLMDRQEREDRGKRGREWALSDRIGFTSRHQGLRFIDNVNKLFEEWKPRERYELINTKPTSHTILNHKL